ncbi:MAG: aminotransferase class V-fold PLP-dependent enzyme, partial [Planctomycetota bacterium]
MIYLDNNATTRIDPQVLNYLHEVWGQLGPANPSSQHGRGRAAKSLLDRSQREIAAMLGADIASTGGHQMIVTSGGTEANAMVLHGLEISAEVRQSAGFGDHHAPPLLYSTIEHPSVYETAQQQQDQRFVR